MPHDKKAPYRLRFDPLLVVMLLLVGLLLRVGWGVVQNHDETREEIQRNSVERSRAQFVETLGAYEQMADFVFRSLVDTDPVKRLFADGVHASDPEEKAVCRDALHKMLEPMYEQLVRYGFGQLHFHEKGNRSFLRFHRPDKFGDDLTAVRQTVACVNREGHYVSGFEEGPLFNGYRFVFPVSCEGEHVGSVEIGVSLRTVVEELRAGFRTEAQFIISADTVRSKVFRSEQSDYVPWRGDERFMVERESADSRVLPDMPAARDLDAVRSALDRQEADGGPLSVEITGRGRPERLVFIPVRNLEGGAIGYLLAALDDRQMSEQNHSFRVAAAVLAALVASLCALMFYHWWSRRKILALAVLDHLTGVYARGVLLDRTEAEFVRFRRHRHPFSVIMVDIDFFKVTNDVFGHQVGDSVLAKVAELIRTATREMDVVGRYGGEEFTVLLPETELAGAVLVAERLRSRVSGHDFDEVGRITVSCGASQVVEADVSVDEVIGRADHCLYQAKEQGRNRVVC